jgi:hypothetical protein
MGNARAILVGVGSVLVALAPKCPVCFLAYFGIFGVTAASASAYRSWLPPLTAISLSVTVGMLALGASRKGRFGPIALGIVGASGVFAGRFIVNSRTMLFGSLLVLVAAVAWKSWRQQTAADASCIACDRLGDKSAWAEAGPTSCAHSSIVTDIKLISDESDQSHLLRLR